MIMLMGNSASGLASLVYLVEMGFFFSILGSWLINKVFNAAVAYDRNCSYMPRFFLTSCPFAFNFGVVSPSTKLAFWHSIRFSLHNLFIRQELCCFQVHGGWIPVDVWTLNLLTVHGHLSASRLLILARFTRTIKKNIGGAGMCERIVKRRKILKLEKIKKILIHS